MSTSLSAGEWVVLLVCLAILAVVSWSLLRATDRRQHRPAPRQPRRPFRLDGELQHMHRDAP